MKFLLLLVLITFLAVSVAKSLRAHRTRSAEERAVAWRMSAFAWMMGLFFITALVFLPNKLRVLMLAPMLLAAVGIGKVWQQARVRARRAAALDFERMKRVH